MSGLVSALPLVPGAFTGGVSLGEWMAGTSFDKLKKEGVAGAEQQGTTARLKQGRRGRGAYKLLAEMEMQEFMKSGGTYAKKHVGVASEMLAKTGKGEAEQFLALKPEEQANVIARLQTGKNVLQAGARQALASTGYQNVSTKEGFNRLADTLVPSLEKLNQTILGMQLAISAQALTRVFEGAAATALLAQTNASRTGPKRGK